MKTIVIMFFVATLVLTQACNRPDGYINPVNISSTEDDVNSINGILIFKSHETFNSFLKRHEPLTESEIRKLEQQYSYNSLVTTQKKSTNFFNNKAIIFSGTSGALLNKDGCIIIGSVLFKFETDKLKSILLKQDVDLLKAVSALKGNDNSLRDEIITSSFDLIQVPITNINKNARIYLGGSTYTDRTTPIEYYFPGSGVPPLAYYCEAVLIFRSADTAGGKMCFMNLTLNPYHDINGGNDYHGIKNDAIVGASGNLIVTFSARYVPGGGPPSQTTMPVSFSTGDIAAASTVNILYTPIPAGYSELRNLYAEGGINYYADFQGGNYASKAWGL